MTGRFAMSIPLSIAHEFDIKGTVELVSSRVRAVTSLLSPKWRIIFVTGTGPDFGKGKSLRCADPFGRWIGSRIDRTLPVYSSADLRRLGAGAEVHV